MAWWGEDPICSTWKVDGGCLPLDLFYDGPWLTLPNLDQWHHMLTEKVCAPQICGLSCSAVQSSMLGSLYFWAIPQNRQGSTSLFVGRVSCIHVTSYTKESASHVLLFPSLEAIDRMSIINVFMILDRLNLLRCCLCFVLSLTFEDTYQQKILCIYIYVYLHVSSILIKLVEIQYQPCQPINTHQQRLHLTPSGVCWTRFMGYIVTLQGWRKDQLDAPIAQWQRRSGFY